MKFKRFLSGVLAGIMAITSSVASISPTAFAADDSTWDLPMLSVERAADTVIDSLYVNGWDPFDVDLRSYGIMNEFTTVTITCVTDETEIVGEDGEAPEAAFGVVINNNWDQATMPRCTYDSNETVFEKTLTAEQLENNPVFTIQSQLPVAAIFTVTVDGLTEDTRAALSLAPLSENVTVYTYDASDWMYGGNCYGSVSIPEENISCDYDITYGSTTVGELRTNVKYISTSAIPYYGDSLDAGADAFEYNVAIVCGNGVVVSTMSSEDSFDLTSPGTTYIDSLCTNELDSFVVYEIRIEISAKLFWNGEISKSQAVSDKIRLAKPNKPIQLEIVEDLRIALPLPAVDKYSMVLTAEEGQDWLIGSYAWEDYIVPDIVGETYGKTTIGAMRRVLKKINTTANTYVSDSLNAGEDAFEYCIDMEANNGEDYIRFGNDSFRLTESGTVYVDNFDYNGTKISSGTYDDYVITAFIIKVQSALGWDDVEKKSFALCEDIRNMTPGDTMTLELAEDTRTTLALDAVSDYAVTLNTYGDDTFGTMVGGSYNYANSELIGKTVSELFDTYKAVTITAPGYFDDSVDAGAEAFVYAPAIRVADANETDPRWLDWDKFALTENGSMNLDQYTTWLESCGDYTVKEVYIYFRAKTDEDQIVNETLRSLEEGTDVVLELREDTRAEMKLPAVTGSMDMYVWEDNTWLIGSSCSGESDALSVSGITYGETTLGDILDGYKTISGEVLPYLSDSLNIGKDAFNYTFGISLENDEFVRFDNWADFDEALTVNVDTLSFTEEQKALKINAITYHVEPKYEPADEKQRAVNETVRGLEPDSSFVITLTAEKPQNVKAVAGDGRVALTWDKVTGATEYVVYFGTGTSLKVYCTTTALGKTVSGLSNGTKYTFLIRAKINGAWSKFTTADFVYATPVAPVVKPTVKAVAGDGRVALTWDKVTGATEYVVYVGTGTSLKVYCTTTALGKTVSGLANGTKYTFLVRAKVDGAWTKFSDADFVYATPEAPVVLKPTVKAVAGDGRVALTWDKVTGATEYVVYVGTGTSLKVYCTTTALGKTVSGLANGTKYTFLVRAKVDGAWTKFSDADFVYATPEAPVVLKPTVKAVAGDGRVALTWDKVTGATEYVVYVGTGTSLKVYCTTTALGKTVSGLKNGTEYTFLVRAKVDGAWTKFTAADFVYATPSAS